MSFNVKTGLRSSQKVSRSSTALSIVKTAKGYSPLSISVEPWERLHTNYQCLNLMWLILNPCALDEGLALIWAVWSYAISIVLALSNTVFPVTDPMKISEKMSLHGSTVDYLFINLYFLFLRLVVDGRIPLIFCNQIITTIKVIPGRAQSFLLETFWYLVFYTVSNIISSGKFPPKGALSRLVTGDNL